MSTLQPVKQQLPEEIMLLIAQHCIDAPFNLEVDTTVEDDRTVLRQKIIGCPDTAQLMLVSKIFGQAIQKRLAHMFTGQFTINILPIESVPWPRLEEPLCNSFWAFKLPCIETILFAFHRQPGRDKQSDVGDFQVIVSFWKDTLLHATRFVLKQPMARYPIHYQFFREINTQSMRRTQLFTFAYSMLRPLVKVLAGRVQEGNLKSVHVSLLIDSNRLHRLHGMEWDCTVHSLRVVDDPECELHGQMTCVQKDSDGNVLMQFTSKPRWEA